MKVQQKKQSNTDYKFELIKQRKKLNYLYGNIYYELKKIITFISQCNKKCSESKVDYYKILCSFYENNMIDGVYFLDNWQTCVLDFAVLIRNFIKGNKIRSIKLELNEIKKAYPFPPGYEYTDEYSERVKYFLI